MNWPINKRKRYNFSWSHIRLSASPHQSSCIMLPPRRFSTQHKIWKANKYAILTVIELGPPVSESLTRTTKRDASEHKFPKNWIQRLAANGKWSVDFFHGNPQTQPLGYIQLSLRRVLIFNTPITSISHPSPRVAST